MEYVSACGLYFLASLSQMTDTLLYNCNSAVDWFRVKADECANGAVKKSQQQAVDSLDRFLGGTPVSLDDINEDLLNEWVAWAFYKGYAYGSVLTYLGRLSALYGKAVKEGVVPKTDSFAQIRVKLKQATDASLEVNAIPDCFSKLRRLVLADFSKNPLRQLAKDLVLFSLYHGGLSFEELAGYRKDDCRGDDDAIQAIVERYARPKNRYLFPLNQSERTANQLNRTISSLFSDALKFVGLHLSAYRSDTAVDLWAAAAMHCGFSAAEIAGCIGTASRVNPLYSFAAGKELTAERIAEIRRRVARILARDPEDWYAMQFRPGVDYDMIQNRMKTVGITFAKSFYPMEEIVRRVGKKMKRESRPVMRGLFFFKSRATGLPELFYRIGDLAWGYRYSKDPRSPYAAIPQKSIEEYETAVGKFVDCIEAHSDGFLRLEEGDKVEITSGEYCGHPAIFEKEIRKITRGSRLVDRVIYRLRLAGIDRYTWTVELDPRQIARISDERFDTLKSDFAQNRN